MRLFKQFTYGAVYLAIFGGLIWLVYSLEFKAAPTCFDNDQNGDETGIDCGGSCVSCEIKNLQPLSIGQAILLGANRDFSAVAAVRNLNSDFGTNSFDYEARFYDKAGVLLKSARGTEFIYPGETKNIIEAGAKIVEGIPVSAEIELLDAGGIKWLKNADFFEPAHELKEAAAYYENGQMIISGYAANMTNSVFSRVVVSAFAFDNLGTKIGASKYEIKSLKPFGAAGFKIFIPIDSALSDVLDFEAAKQSISIEVLK